MFEYREQEIKNWVESERLAQEAKKEQQVTVGENALARQSTCKI
jgi:hypothetical protein